MKKIALSSILFIALGLTSCKKDRVCECTNTSTAAGSTTTTTETTHVKVTKRTAKRACVKETYTNGSVTDTYDCKLK